MEDFPILVGKITLLMSHLTRLFYVVDFPRLVVNTTLLMSLEFGISIKGLLKLVICDKLIPINMNTLMINIYISNKMLKWSMIILALFFMIFFLFIS